LRIEIHAGWLVLYHYPLSIIHSQFLGYGGGFCEGGWGEEGDGGGLSDWWCGEGARQRASITDFLSAS
jgi:hypothetical protein